MAGNYKNYLKLLELWPLDKSKPGRDLGQHIRDQVKVAFSKGEVGNNINQEQCNRHYESLHRIVENYYGKTYPRTLSSSASGLTKEQCNQALSPEFNEYLKYYDSSFREKVRFSITAFFHKRNKGK